MKKQNLITALDVADVFNGFKSDKERIKYMSNAYKNMNINNNQHRGDSEGRNLPKISTRKNINRDDDMIGMESGNEMGDEVDPNQPKM